MTPQRRDLRPTLRTDWELQQDDYSLLSCPHNAIGIGFSSQDKNWSAKGRADGAKKQEHQQRRDAGLRGDAVAGGRLAKAIIVP